jgi:hypothetical protein
MSRLIFIFIIAFSIFIGVFREDEHHGHFTNEIDKSENIKISGDILRESIFNYISCLDAGLDIIDNSMPVMGGLKNFTYERTYNKVMKNREFISHIVEDGENLDDIIKKYNTDIDDIDDFRKVTKEKNKTKVSDTYDIQSGEELLIPSEK